MTFSESSEGAFSGQDGVLVVRVGQGGNPMIFVFRGNRIWKLDPSQTQSLNTKPWGVLE